MSNQFKNTFKIGHYGWLSLIKKPISLTANVPKGISAPLTFPIGIPIKNMETVYVFGCGDIRPNLKGKIEFPDTKNVIFRKCDKNFTYYWLNKTVFPKSNNIYILDYPFDKEILNRFKNNNIYVDAEFFPYYYNIDVIQNNVRLICKDEKEKLFGINDRFYEIIDKLVNK